jgi:hypothetical protein
MRFQLSFKRFQLFYWLLPGKMFIWLLDIYVFRYLCTVCVRAPALPCNRKTINQINADARPKHYGACGMVGGDIAGLLLSRAIKEESLG